MIALALLAATAAIPQPTELKLFKDWTVGCDNGLSCQAVALMPEDMPEGFATMSLSRGAEADAAPIVRITLEGEGAAGLAADGRKLDAKLTKDDGAARVEPAGMPAVLAALRSAARLDVLNVRGEKIGTVSLAGASAALLFIDERQKRIGTTGALVRPGPAAPSRMPPALPIVQAARVATGKPHALGPARVEALRKAQGCEIEEVGGPDEVEVHLLDGHRSLVLLACGSGAYNVTTVPLVAEGSGADMKIAPAKFDRMESWWENGQPMLVNAGWEAATSSLGSFSKGRGLGDCGTSQNYVWDGAMFRLVEQSEMGECRGSTDYITTWRALVRR